MRALEAARTALERRGWTVVAGFLAPAGDEFLKGKLGVRPGPSRSEHDCAKSRPATRSGSDSEWVDVCSWGEFRSYRLCSALREHLERECAVLRGRSAVCSGSPRATLDQKLSAACAGAGIEGPMRNFHMCSVAGREPCSRAMRINLSVSYSHRPAP